MAADIGTGNEDARGSVEARPQRRRTRVVNDKTWEAYSHPLSYKKAFQTDLIPSAVFLDRKRFEAAVQMCSLVAALAKRIDGKRVRGRKYHSANLSPEFRAMAWEVRAALARACQRELYVIGWEDLTPRSGTPDLKFRPHWQRAPSRK